MKAAPAEVDVMRLMALHTNRMRDLRREILSDLNITGR
jgi:hypothetical protein